MMLTTTINTLKSILEAHRDPAREPNWEGETGVLREEKENVRQMSKVDSRYESAYRCVNEAWMCASRRDPQKLMEHLGNAIAELEDALNP